MIMKDKLIAGLPIILLFLAFGFLLFGLTDKAHAESTVLDNHMTSTGQGGPFNAGGFGANGTRSIGELIDPSSDLTGINAMRMRIVVESQAAYDNVSNDSWQAHVFETPDGTTLGTLVASSISNYAPDLITYNSTTTTWTSGQSGYATTSLADSNLYVQFDFSTFTLLDSKQYILLVSWDGTYSSGSNVTAVTLQTNTTGGRWIDDGTPSSSDVTNTTASHSLSFALYSGASPIGDYSTRIISLETPENGTTTASNTVAFEVSYVSDIPAPARICLNIDNLTAFQSLVPKCQNIITSGFLSFATTTSLVTGNNYRWSAVLYGSSNNIIDTSELHTFWVVNQTANPFDPSGSGWPFGPAPLGTTSTSTLGDLTLECDPEDNFFSRSICNVAVLLFVPGPDSIAQLNNSVTNLQSKQPFSAFNEFRTAWNTSIKNPDVEYSSLTLVFYGENVPIISTSTLAGVAGDNSLSTLRFLIAAGLWIALAWFMFNRVSKFF